MLNGRDEDPSHGDTLFDLQGPSLYHKTSLSIVMNMYIIDEHRQDIKRLEKERTVGGLVP